jgi:GTP-binding protein
VTGIREHEPRGDADTPQRPDRIVARFLTSAPTLRECPPDDVPEVAIVGRSNAGKSSVLNQLTRNRQLARTSKTPGRTQLLNFFDTSLGGRLVDLPGYGYARVAKTQKHVWETHVDAYLANRAQLVATVLVMDVRHPFEPFDAMITEWTQRAQLPMLVLLNKADKLKHGAQRQALRVARQRLSDARFTVQLFSALSGQGRVEAIETLRRWLTPELGRTPDASSG